MIHIKSILKILIIAKVGFKYYMETQENYKKSFRAKKIIKLKKLNFKSKRMNVHLSLSCINRYTNLR